MVGVDLGGSGLRAVQFRLGKGAPVIERAAYAPLPAGAVERGEVLDREAVSDALKSMWAAERFKSKDVVFGLAGDNVLVRQMDLPWMLPADFRQALPYQAADYLPMNIDDASVDYHVLGEYETTSPEGARQRFSRILLVAAAKATVNTFVEAIQQAGLQPVKAELVPFALIRAADPAPVEPDVAEAVIDIGADVTNVIIHQAGQPRFVRMVTGQAGRTLTTTLVDRYAWTQEEAERSKIELGLGGAGVAVESAENSVFGTPIQQISYDQHPAQQVIDHVVSGFLSEIQTSVDYFLAQSDQINTISRVVLSGGTGNTKGLAQRLASQLRVEVVHSTPMARFASNVAVPAGMSEQQMAVAVGLTLGAV